MLITHLEYCVQLWEPQESVCNHKESTVPLCAIEGTQSKKTRIDSLQSAGQLSCES